ncbi:DinB family protein [Seonamhaeicola sp. MEBiC1930]|uniref:DUF1572 family protein n=1 Tax=Seonamhaeicola sp. MEBiC01930 TaxID=2976768 RepID=UPI003252224E
MLPDTLIQLFKRDLNKLKIEIDAYKTESSLWFLDKDINNTAGNLCLHVIGNLNHFIGAIIGNSGYVRRRDLEFSLNNIPKKDMLIQIDDTVQMIEKVLKHLSTKTLEEVYPVEVFGKPMTTEYFLVHLTTHLAYHLGQINYHRRLLDSLE